MLRNGARGRRVARADRIAFVATPVAALPCAALCIALCIALAGCVRSVPDAVRPYLGEWRAVGSSQGFPSGSLLEVDEGGELVLARGSSRLVSAWGFDATASRLYAGEFRAQGDATDQKRQGRAYDIILSDKGLVVTRRLDGGTQAFSRGIALEATAAAPATAKAPAPKLADAAAYLGDWALKVDAARRLTIKADGGYAETGPGPRAGRWEPVAEGRGIRLSPADAAEGGQEWLALADGGSLALSPIGKNGEVATRIYGRAAPAAAKPSSGKPARESFFARYDRSGPSMDAEGAAEFAAQGPRGLWISEAAGGLPERAWLFREGSLDRWTIDPAAESPFTASADEPWIDRYFWSFDGSELVLSSLVGRDPLERYKVGALRGWDIEGIAGRMDLSGAARFKLANTGESPSTVSLPSGEAPETRDGGAAQ